MLNLIYLLKIKFHYNPLLHAQFIFIQKYFFYFRKKNMRFIRTIPNE